MRKPGLKKRLSPEHALQVRLVREIRMNGRKGMFRFAAIPNGGHRNLRTAIKLKAEGVERGAPDLTFCLKGGRWASLELKSEKGRLSPEQIAWRNDILALGGLWESTNDFDQGCGILAAWGVLPSAVERSSDE